MTIEPSGIPSLDQILEKRTPYEIEIDKILDDLHKNGKSFVMELLEES